MNSVEAIDIKTVNGKANAEPVTKTISGSIAVLEACIAEGVETIFGYPGGAIMPIYDALYDYREKLEHILVRHEQGATHAAQGYARVSGRTGVVFATSAIFAASCWRWMLGDAERAAIAGTMGSYVKGILSSRRGPIL